MKAMVRLSLFVVVLFGTSRASAQYVPPLTKPDLEGFPLYAATEPLAKEFALDKSRDYLDRMAKRWLTGNLEQACMNCHVNFPYLMSRGLLSQPERSLETQTRQGLEKWAEEFVKGNWRNNFDPGMAGMTAATLAIEDARMGMLRPITRQALDKMWTIRGAIGDIGREKVCSCSGGLQPIEFANYTRAAYIAMAVGMAPDRYAESEKGRLGLERLRGYFRKFPPKAAYQRAMLLWASLHTDGLLNDEERRVAIRALLDQQRSDGGWSVAGLLAGDRNAGGDPSNGRSDGYGTGFVIYVLRQAGVSAHRDEIQRGLSWLRRNQRASGAWFTPSEADHFDRDRRLYFVNAGTAFAVLALNACDTSDAVSQVADPSRFALSRMSRKQIDVFRP